MSNIQIKYSHMKQHKVFPGPVLLKMELYLYNSLDVQYIEDVVVKFKNLKLFTFTGENIVKFATVILHFLKGIDTVYSLPYKTGSQLLSKVENTSSKYFNNKVMVLQDIVKKMEREIGLLKSPALLKYEGVPDAWSFCSMCGTKDVVWIPEEVA